MSQNSSADSLIILLDSSDSEEDGVVLVSETDDQEGLGKLEEEGKKIKSCDSFEHFVKEGSEQSCSTPKHEVNNRDLKSVSESSIGDSIRLDCKIDKEFSDSGDTNNNVEKDDVLPDPSITDQLALSDDDDKISLAPSLEMFSGDEIEEENPSEVTEKSAELSKSKPDLHNNLISYSSNKATEESFFSVEQSTNIPSNDSREKDKSRDPRKSPSRKRSLPPARVVSKRQTLPLDPEDPPSSPEPDCGPDVYAYGNYCRQVLGGSLCSKGVCSWVHWLAPEHAVTQLFRISAHRPREELLTFARFFINPDIQERLLEEAGEAVGEDTCKDYRAVCRAVFRALVSLCENIVLEGEVYLELLNASTALFTVHEGAEVLVTLFSLASKALAPPQGSQEDRLLLVDWAWSKLYQEALTQGILLPSHFYSGLSFQLSCLSSATLQLCELSLYMALLPSLQPCLSSVAHLLSSSDTEAPPCLTDPDTSLFTARVLSTFSTSDWQNLAQLGDIKTGLIKLVYAVKQESPEDIFAFFENLPEIEGLEVPNVKRTSVSDLRLRLRNFYTKHRWQALSDLFLKINPKDIESMSEFSEEMLISFANSEGKVDNFSVFTSMVKYLNKKGTPVHFQFLHQIGLGLLLCLANNSMWDKAMTCLNFMRTQLMTDFLALKLPVVDIFSQMTPYLTPLSVLEILLQNRARTDLVNLLLHWKYLKNISGTEVEQERRDKLFIKIIIWLLEANDESLLVLLIELSHIVAPSMRRTSEPCERSREEDLSNRLLVKMLNLNSPGPALWKQFQLVRNCRHQLTQSTGRGLVFRLSYCRLLDSALKVYQSLVRWGTYSLNRHQARPLRLLLGTNLTLEEMYVILTDFLANLKTSTEKRCKAENSEGDESLQVFLILNVASSNSEVKHLNCVGSTKEEALERLQKTLKMFVPPLAVEYGSVPYIVESSVRNYIAYNT